MIGLPWSHYTQEVLPDEQHPHAGRPSPRSEGRATVSWEAEAGDLRAEVFLGSALCSIWAGASKAANRAGALELGASRAAPPWAGETGLTGGPACWPSGMVLWGGAEP